MNNGKVKTDYVRIGFKSMLTPEECCGVYDRLFGKHPNLFKMENRPGTESPLGPKVRTELTDVLTLVAFWKLFGFSSEQIAAFLIWISNAFYDGRIFFSPYERFSLPKAIRPDEGFDLVVKIVENHLQLMSSIKLPEIHRSEYEMFFFKVFEQFPIPYTIGLEYIEVEPYPKGGFNAFEFCIRPVGTNEVPTLLMCAPLEEAVQGLSPERRSLIEKMVTEVMIPVTPDGTKNAPPGLRKELEKYLKDAQQSQGEKK